jgi:predicted RNase H-related nuclease YkuK (DUF458 family)
LEQKVIVKRYMDRKAVRDFMSNSSPSTKIYIGSDSTRHKTKGVWMADYTTVVVFHIDGNKGCKIFGQVESERDYDQKKNKPSMRLMNEVIRTANMYLELEDAFDGRQVQIHMDISADKLHGSSCVINEAIGYIRGTCNIDPLVKPDAFCASYAADRYTETVLPIQRRAEKALYKALKKA